MQNWLETPLDEGHPCKEWERAQKFWEIHSKTTQKRTTFCNSDKANTYVTKLQQVVQLLKSPHANAAAKKHVLASQEFFKTVSQIIEQERRGTTDGNININQALNNINVVTANVDQMLNDREQQLQLQVVCFLFILF